MPESFDFLFTAAREAGDPLRSYEIVSRGRLELLAPPHFVDDCRRDRFVLLRFSQTLDELAS